MAGRARACCNNATIRRTQMFEQYIYFPITMNSCDTCFIHVRCVVYDNVEFKIGIHSTLATNDAAQQTYTFGRFSERVAYRHTLVCKRARDLFRAFAHNRDGVQRVVNKATWRVTLSADTIIQRRCSGALRVIGIEHSAFAGTFAATFADGTRESAMQKKNAAIVRRANDRTRTREEWRARCVA